MTREQEIEAQLKAATPGPWQWCNWGDAEPDGVDADFTLEAPPETRPDWGPDVKYPDLPNGILTDADREVSRADRDLIANAPADLRYLLDQLQRWRNIGESLLILDERVRTNLVMSPECQTLLKEIIQDMPK